MKQLFAILAALFVALAVRGADIDLSAKLSPTRMRVMGTEYGLGVTGGIPARTDPEKIVDITASPYNFVAGGNLTTPLTNALNDLAGVGGEKVILIPAGSHTMTNIVLPYSGGGNVPWGNYTIRGAGMGNTTITATGGFAGGNQPVFTDSTATILSGMTKDSNAVTVADASTFLANHFAQIEVPNDYRIPVMRPDNTSQYNRLMVVYVTAVDTGTDTITFTPPLPKDFTDLEALTGLAPRIKAETSRSPMRRVGLEGFTLVTSGSSAFELSGAWECWLKDIKYSGHGNHGFQLNVGVKFEMRKCHVGASSGGGGSNKSGILASYTTSALFEDNILEVNQPCIEFWLGNTNSVFAYNFLPIGVNGLTFNVHNNHNHFILIEGNIMPGLQVDTYFGSASDIGIHRNWMTGRRGQHVPAGNLTRSGGTATVITPTFHGLTTGNTISVRGATQADYNGEHSVTVTSTTSFTYAVSNSPASPATGAVTVSSTDSATDIQRFTRNWFMTGNLLRSPNFTNNDNGYYFGYPYGGSAMGTAEPSTNDYWVDWDTVNNRTKSWTAELTTRTSDTVGVVTFASSGEANDFEASLDAGANRARATSFAGFAYMDEPSGLTYGIYGTSDNLPTVNSTITFYPGVLGFRERDLDVPNTATLKHNYNYYDPGIPAGEALGSDTLPTSYYQSSKPAWFGDRPWPPINASSPPATWDATTISAALPAAYRYVNGNENYLASGTQATVTGTLNVTGTIILP